MVLAGGLAALRDDERRRAPTARLRGVTMTGNKRVALAGALLVASAITASAASPAAAQDGGGGTRSIPASGTTTIRPLPPGSGELAQPELRPRRPHQGEAGEFNRPHPGFKNGQFPKRPLDAPVVTSSPVTGSDATLSFLGLNHRDQRLANGGNQFSLEPPDQALCVGNGFTVEGTNSVLRVFSSATGAPLTGVQDINTFFQYPAAINRTTGVFGPFVIDPVCLYDGDTNRFVFVITTLGQVPATGAFTGKNTIDVAVSNSGDPTGTWTVYKIPAHNDGTDGTPDHGCTLDGVAHGPCFQDYPHIGVDANGVYVSTNEYDLFGPGYNAAQIFAFSKAELAAHPSSIRVTLVENLQLAGSPGFTVWPAISQPGEHSTEANGTEYFLSTIAGDGTETGNPTGTARRIGVWALTNTSSLDDATPALGITSRLVNSTTYVFPPLSTQPAGPFPLGECINDTTIPTPFGPGCWQLLFLPEDEPDHDEVISSPDSLDTRMQQTWYVNGHLWGSAGTAVRVGGQLRAGIVWFDVEPKITGAGKVGAKLKQEGYLALENNNLTMPAIAMNADGDGAIAFTIMGETFYPTAAYARIDDTGTVGPIRVAATGVGVTDGFTSYKAFVGDPPRTRWGDYGATVIDGDDIWVASEYIAQSCTLTQYLTGAIGSCGGTRTALGNWATRVTKLSTP
jgi:hypothetical protein